MSQTDLWGELERRLDSMTASPDTQTGLAFLHRVCELMGGVADLPAVHIAGTNGKGSTAASLDSMLREAGYKTALYTSPHLSVFGERLRINGAMLAPEDWHEALDRVQKALEACPECRPGYFQISTAAAFWLMKRERCQVCVVEAGIGGLEDATNVLVAPLLSVITPLGMDHMHKLGDTLESIAEHKFGIIRPGGRALFCGSPAEMDRLFLHACERAGAQGELFARTCAVSEVKTTLDGNEFTLRTPEGQCRWSTRLVGIFQPENASLALRALELIGDVLPVSENAKRSGLAHVVWPGRMEVFGRDPDLILDGAHNPHGAAALIRSLTALYGAEAPLSFVYTSMADKNYLEVLRLYARAFPRARLFCTELADFPRCERAGELAVKALPLGWSAPPDVYADPAQALRAAQSRGGPVIVCGSLYFVARMRELVNDR